MDRATIVILMLTDMLTDTPTGTLTDTPTDTPTGTLTDTPTGTATTTMDLLTDWDTATG